MGHKPHQRANAATAVVPREVQIAQSDARRANQRYERERRRADEAARGELCAKARAEDLQRLLDAAMERINMLEAQQPSVACGHDVEGGAKMLCGCVLIEDRSQCDTPDHTHAILEVVTQQVA